MYRQVVAALLLVSALSLPASAWAQGNGQGGGNGNGPDNAGASANGNSGNGPSNGNGGDPPGPPTGPGASANSGGAATPPGRKAVPGQGSELSQSEVLAAVESGGAISLETILPDVRTRTGGEVIDAKLQRNQGFLLYAVTVLTPAGKVLTEYYYARSGIHVENR